MLSAYTIIIAITHQILELTFGKVSRHNKLLGDQTLWVCRVNLALNQIATCQDCALEWGFIIAIKENMLSFWAEESWSHACTLLWSSFYNLSLGARELHRICVRMGGCRRLFWWCHVRACPAGANYCWGWPFSPLWHLEGPSTHLLHILGGITFHVWL